MTLPQAVILVAINKVKWLRRELKDQEKAAEKPSFMNQIINSSNDIKFDFNKYKHLQKHYNLLPDHIKKRCADCVKLIDEDNK